MGILSSLLGKKKDTTSLLIRETLFGDMPMDQFPNGDGDTGLFPWSEFIAARHDLAEGRKSDAFAKWQGLATNVELEPRVRLQAWHFLRQHGQQPPSEAAKELLGVVVEVALDEGLDLLAAYPDHSARYYNYGGGGIVWERPDSSLDFVIDDLLDAAKDVVAKIGPWEFDRPPAPPVGCVRMGFLTPSGLHFGQGRAEVISADPLGRRVFDMAGVLMRALIAKT